ncbi:Thioesterase superfamily protein [Candidatus Promineifilum breve]|uniref:Thioesterase superfamily protein n=1 Tax=Candidatus Promineifilum breve TaxID=1806508 RepID=A0A160SZM9_9CHLR|nr:acyl-CoA thioesterase [Candidatus Promineifilum breve]CUS02532.2 Thioesterase superfamily protein [Candidatus Promineifilum breve]
MMGQTVSASRTILTQPMGVTEGNLLGNVHGGVLMKLCDDAGAIAAMKHARRPVVTVAVDSMSFHSAVQIGDLLTVRAEVTWVGRSSLETRLVVTAENLMTGDITHTNTAYYVYVALNARGEPAQAPPLICETDEERALFEAGAARQAQRLERRRREQPVDLTNHADAS